MKIHFENHPSFKPQDKAVLEMQLWEKIADAGVLIGPGWMFAASEDIQKETEGHLRIAFSLVDVSKILLAVSMKLTIFVLSLIP